MTEPGTGHASSVSFSPEDNGKFSLTANTPTHGITVMNRFDKVDVEGVTAGRGTGGVVGVATGTLPFTGSPLAMLVKIAVWLLTIGGIALLIARKLRRRGSPA